MATKTTTETKTYTRWRVLMKHKRAKRFTQPKDWAGQPLEFVTLNNAKRFVQSRVEDPRWAGTEFKTEGRVTVITSVIETTDWIPAHKVHV